jgi:DNA-binding IclR family transcriptional regulator
VKQIKNGKHIGKTEQHIKVSSADRLLKLLMIFADKSDPRSVENLADELDLPHSTTYRYVKTLSDVGLIVAVSAGSYILGPSIIVLDRQMRLSDPLLNSAERVKSRLAKELPGPGMILICRLFRNSVMCVDSAGSGKLGFVVSYSRGRALPLYRGAASKVILAHLPLRNVRALFDAESSEFENAGLGSDWKTVRTSLRKIRQQSFSITHGELDSGALGFGSPVLGPDGQVVGSLAYVTQEQTFDQETFDKICAAVKSGAREIEDNLAKFLRSTGVDTEEFGRI